jgi:hypothetical protein
MIAWWAAVKQLTADLTRLRSPHRRMSLSEASQYVIESEVLVAKRAKRAGLPEDLHVEMSCSPSLKRRVLRAVAAERARGVGKVGKRARRGKVGKF